METLWFDIVGTVGVGCILLAYLLVTTERIRPISPKYLWLNIIGSALILVSLYASFNLPSAIIQCAWITISLFSLRRRA